MSRGAYLLDTSMAIDLLHNEPNAVRGMADAEQLFLTAIVLGELYLGAEGAPTPADEHRKVDSFVAAIPILPFDLDTAKTYAALKYGLRRRGSPIPDNDLWIAAAAVRHGVTLAARDRHFEVVNGLSIDRWES